MISFNLQEIFSIQYYTDPNWIVKKDNKNYIEIIFVEQGNGIHTINGVKLPYTTKDVFLNVKDGEHSLHITKKSTFCVFQFTDDLFSSKVDVVDLAQWIRKIEFILRHPNLKPDYAVNSGKEQDLIWSMHSLIKTEYEKKREFYQGIIVNMVSIMLSIIARNINEDQATQEIKKPDNKAVIDIEDLLGYIHKHVYEPSKMKISFLASTFNMTSSALSAYFKKMTGKSIHHYILQYKLELVKYRLQNSEFTVSQIAHQLGFTDESHLTRIFKKYFNTTPKKYRQEL